MVVLGLVGAKGMAGDANNSIVFSDDCVGNRTRVHVRQWIRIYYFTKRFRNESFFFLFLFDDLSFLNVKSEKFEKLFLCDGIDLIESTLGIDLVESTDSSISSMELFSSS